MAEVLFGDGGNVSRSDLPSRTFPSAARLPVTFMRTAVHAPVEERDSTSVPRILAGCGADPLEEVRAGRLLDELYSSLAVLTLSLPPLRERMADLPSLVDRMLQRCNAEGRRPIKGLTADALEVIRAHAWPAICANSTPFSPRRGAMRTRPHHGRRPARLAAARNGAWRRRPLQRERGRCRSTLYWRKRSAD